MTYRLRIKNSYIQIVHRKSSCLTKNSIHSYTLYLVKIYYVKSCNNARLPTKAIGGQTRNLLLCYIILRTGQYMLHKILGQRTTTIGQSHSEFSPRALLFPTALTFKC